MAGDIIESIENIYMLLAVIIGLIFCLIRYIETPKRGWFFGALFLLTHLLSDYYWTIYTFVMQENPSVSDMMGYFGWNAAYFFLMCLAISMQTPEARRYFHPLMLLPIPLNIWQFIIYIQYGGLLNNIWEGGIMTIAAVVCMQSILYSFKNRKAGAVLPWIHIYILLNIFVEYGMWTASCYEWGEGLLYNCFAFSSHTLAIFYAWAVGRQYKAEGFKRREKNTLEMRFQFVLQVIVTAIILFGCLGGYYLANWMKNTLPAGTEDENVYSIIAVTLFIISVFLDILILAIIFLTAIRYKSAEKTETTATPEKRSRFNFIFTLVVTFALMVFSVAHTSRQFYRVSVTNINESGEDKAAEVATELENYLAVAKSILWVTADTVDLMIGAGEPQDAIRQYLVDQTSNQSEQFDENFTGLYAYVNGEYLDGLEWVPPDDYNAEERDWYKCAVDAGGEVIIVSPYVDAQTNSVVITFCKLLQDGGEPGNYDKRNVVALDVIVNHIQDVTEQVDVGGKGYGIVVNRDGLIISSNNPEQNGKNLQDIYGEELLDTVLTNGGGMQDSAIDGEDCTLFIHQVMDQWYVMIVVTNAELLSDVQTQLLVSIVVSLIIFLLISFFYYLGYKNEQAYSRKVEEMNIGRQKQEYEAQVLKLEKNAADEANKAKSSFLADMSHEIRTPINAILGMNEMILRESGDRSILEYARNIRVSGRNLLQIINSILDFSKIEDGKMEIVPVTYSVSAMITYLVNSIQERARAKNLDLNLHIDPALPRELYGDDTRISQIIMNLLTNAVKYTPEGSVTLTVKTADRTDERVLLYVEVRDTGIGIKESDMDKLFESFERLDLTRNRNIEGTGLGMSITTRLLALMDSELKVESTYGEGSVFSFELWQKIEDGEALGDYKLASPEEEEDETGDESFRAPDARILIVDDTRMNIVVATGLLKYTGMQMDTALCGEEALLLTKENVYDIILLDQRMPGMDGTQTLQAIREQGGGRNTETPVICLTADAIRGARERYMAQGFTDYLTKPVNGRSLERMLINYLPADKVHTVTAEEKTPAAAGTKPADAPADPLFAALSAEGVDTDKGLAFCQGEMELYRTFLSEYVKEASARREKMTAYYAAHDWENYSIYVHSLKSTSKTIGAQELSDLAAGLERASKDGDESVLTRDHDRTMEIYDRLVSVIRSQPDIAGTQNDTQSDEDGVFVFNAE